MPDLAKVIKGLEYCSGSKCVVECPYYAFDNCYDRVMEDAIALLKEQEPVKPVPEYNNRCTGWYVCGNCHEPIDNGDAFCRYCERRIDWYA